MSDWTLAVTEHAKVPLCLQRLLNNPRAMIEFRGNQLNRQRFVGVGCRNCDNVGKTTRYVSAFEFGLRRK
jgi:hypothetical protein